MFARNSLSLRIAMMCAAMVTVTIALTGAAILWIFTISSERILDNHLMAYSDAIISQIETKNNAVTLKDDGKFIRSLPRYWQISDNEKPLFKSDNIDAWVPLKPENMHEFQHIEWRNAEGNKVIALQATFLFPHDRKITLLSGLEAKVAGAYESQERDALTTPLLRVLLAAALALTGLGIFLAYIAMRPVSQVKAALQDIRAGKSQRLQGNYPREIKALTDEINYLLDYTAGSIAKHREFSSNLAHSLKTPLTVIANETDINIIKTKLRSLMDIVERSLARVHAAGTANILSASTPVLPVIVDISDGFGKVYAKHVAVDCPPDISFKGDQADLYEVLGNIIENACKFSNSRVSISMQNSAVIVEDDGQGIPEEKRASVLQRGTRLDETKPGTGIGLAVASDIVALYGGNIHLETSALGGLKVLVFLPLSS
ncbi:MAG: ATP-binding protein [Micavibrio sp.]|nr:ATP-binding protein [Micavibrio sp.]